MSDKLIPGGDWEFYQFAIAFSNRIANDPSVYQIAPAEAEALVAMVTRLGETLQQARTPHTRSPMVTAEKDRCRAEVERTIRRLAKLIRASDKIAPLAKVQLGLSDQPARAKKQTCPKEPPQLRFSRVVHQQVGSMPMHELTFSSADSMRKTKPDGAVRLELFVDLVPPDEPIPTHPGANHGGRPWYLRSYTRSPIVLTPPMARVPMRVVYWARWADSTGNVGPFSATAVGWVEGGNISRPALVPRGGSQAVPLVDLATPALEQNRDATYTVALIETHYLSLNAPVMAEPKQIEDQTRVEAA